MESFERQAQISCGTHKKHQPKSYTVANNTRRISKNLALWAKHLQKLVEAVKRNNKLSRLRQRATAFCLGYRLSKHKMTRYARNFGAWPPWTPLATPMSRLNAKNPKGAKTQHTKPKQCRMECSH